MPKLEEKLIELGYRINPAYLSWDHEKLYCKLFKDITLIIIATDLIINSWITPYCKHIYTQPDLDDLQQAFNILQHDLEVLKKHETKD